MSKNNRKPSPRPQNPPRFDAAGQSEPFYKKPWVVLLGSAIAVVFTFLLNAPTFFQNLRGLPEEIHKTNSELLSWAKEDAEWTGLWSSSSEGFVDGGDLILSDADIQITIWSKEGKIHGTIATGEICKVLPVFNYVLLNGEVTGDTAVGYCVGHH